MDKVNSLIDGGARIPTAVKEALLPLTLTEFADKHELPRSAVSNAINGNVRATDEMVAALIQELGGTVDDWRNLLWKAGKPESAKAS
jgi:plasmid maintenance system antidote protein VapI